MRACVYLFAPVFTCVLSRARYITDDTRKVWPLRVFFTTTANCVEHPAHPECMSHLFIWQLSSHYFSSNNVIGRKYKTDKQKTFRKPFLQQEHSKLITAVTKSKGNQTFNTGIYIYYIYKTKHLQSHLVTMSSGYSSAKGVLSKDY